MSSPFQPAQRKLRIEGEYLQKVLLELLAIPSPAGLTDEIVHYTCGRLEEMGIAYELTRRGTIRCVLRRTLPERREFSPSCAIVSHLDTLGAMVREIKPNGRLALAPIGTWSSRWAEGGRVTLFTEHRRYRGTVLPLLASGHVYNELVDQQPVNWAQLELRLDADIHSEIQAISNDIRVGDFVAFDAQPEILENGYIVSRHLDDKAGVAAVLAAIKALIEARVDIHRNCHIVFTLSEEVGSGARAVIQSDVSEVIGIDIGPVAAGQGARETGVTIPMMDSAGPHDYHLTHRLLAMCEQHGIPAQRDVFPFYHSDAGAAVSAGHDVRTALLCFGCDASHGYERTHMSSLMALAELLTVYIQSGLTMAGDRCQRMDSANDFPHQLEPHQLEREQTVTPPARELVPREHEPPVGGGVPS
jgi:peptidase M42 family hydrolase